MEPGVALDEPDSVCDLDYGLWLLVVKLTSRSGRSNLGAQKRLLSILRS